MTKKTTGCVLAALFALGCSGRAEEPLEKSTVAIRSWAKGRDLPVARVSATSRVLATSRGARSRILELSDEARRNEELRRWDAEVEKILVAMGHGEDPELRAVFESAGAIGRKEGER